MINPLVLYGAGAALLVGLFAGWSIRDWKADADTLAAYERADKLRDDMQAKIDAGSVRYEDWRSGATERSIETRNTIREIYRNVEVPADCAPPAAATSVLKERVGAANAAATGQSGGAVSEDSRASRSSD